MLPNTMQLKIDHIDHVVLTVQNPVATADFYQRVAGLSVERFGVNQERLALTFGDQKLNLHQAGAEYKPHATYPTPGSVDICFITHTPLLTAMQQVRNEGVDIEEGPVQRTGAKGPIQSFYFRDPDGNLVEIANYPSPMAHNNGFQWLNSPLLSGLPSWTVSTVALLMAQRTLKEVSGGPPLAVAVGFLAAIGFNWWQNADGRVAGVTASHYSL